MFKILVKVYVQQKAGLSILCNEIMRKVIASNLVELLFRCVLNFYIMNNFTFILDIRNIITCTFFNICIDYTLLLDDIV